MPGIAAVFAVSLQSGSGGPVMRLSAVGTPSTSSDNTRLPPRTWVEKATERGGGADIAEPADGARVERVMALDGG
jgi:hypothetical protein